MIKRLVLFFSIYILAFVAIFNLSIPYRYQQNILTFPIALPFILSLFYFAFSIARKK